MMDKKVILNGECLEKLKNTFNDKDIVEDKEQKKIEFQKLNMGLDKIVLAKLYIKAIDNLTKLLNLRENSVEKEIRNLKEYLKEREDIDLRDLIEDYGDGKYFGSYYTGEKIRDIAKNKRKEMKETIEVFFFILGEEE